MSIQEFYEELMIEFDHQATATGEYKASLYLEKVMPYLYEQGVFDDADLFHVNKTHFGRLDGLAFNGDLENPESVNNEMVLIVNDFQNTSSELKTLTNTRIDQLKNAVKRFYKRSLDEGFIDKLEESSDAYSATIRILQNYHKVSKLKILIITNAIISKRVADFKTQENDIDKPLKLDIWDIQRLYDLESSLNRSEAIEIDLAQWGGSMSALPATNTDELDSYLCIISGKTIADLYEEYGSRLLEANVRSFLQFRGKINKGIRKTINTEPELFFSYNNGLTATASEVVFDKDNQKITKIKNLQIVNGGQTTASLLYTRIKDKTDLCNINVQLKLNVINHDKADEIIANISKYANSQNKIQDSDFFSNHPFHRRFEEMSRRIWAPAGNNNIRQTHWYYERARGAYLNEQARLTPSAKKEFKSKNPKNQLISKTDFAKVYLVFEKRAHDSVKGAQIAFREFAKIIDDIWKKDNSLINDNFFKEIIVKFIVWKSCKDVVYKQDFVGNTKATIHAYTISIIKWMMDNEHLHFDYEKIWQKQEVPFLYLSLFENISKNTYSLLNSLSQKTGKAILSMAKSKECLDLVMKMVDTDHSFTLPLDVKVTLITEEKYKVSLNVSQLEGKIDSEIRDINKLVTIPLKKWYEILDNDITQQILTPNDIDILSIIPKLMRGESKKNPTDKQVAKINNLLDILDDNGVYV